MKTTNQNHTLNQVNPGSAFNMQTKQVSSISFQMEIDRIIRKISHAKRVSDKDRCREMMDRATSLIHDFSTI